MPNMKAAALYRPFVVWTECIIGLAAALLLLSSAPPDPLPPPGKPPIAPVRKVVDDYFGIKVTDPYRYLENLQDQEVQAWLKAQNDFTKATLGRQRARASLLARVKELDESAPGRVGGIRRLPAGPIFYLKALSKESVFKLVMRDHGAGEERVLVDPEGMADGGPPHTIDYYTPSDDGNYVAYGVSPGGSGESVMRILDTPTRQNTAEIIDRAEFGDHIGWRPDGRSFFYNRLQATPTNSPPSEKYLRSRVYLHVVGADPAKDVPAFGFGVSPRVRLEPADIPWIMTAPGSRHVLGIVQHGVQNEVTVYVAPLDSVATPDTPWRKVCDVEDDVTSVALRGDDLYLMTHKNASRFKVIHTRASKPDLGRADVILAPSEAVVTDLAVAHDALYVRIRDGAGGRLLRVPFAAGAKPEPVELPSDTSIGIEPSDPRIPGVVFIGMGWTRAPRVFAYDPRTKRVANLGLLPAGTFDSPPSLEALEVKVRSADGTMIPLSIIHTRGLTLDGSHPTRLYGYGAYGISIDPYYDPKSLAWLERGGVYAVAHVRGGGEYGEDWHQAGRKLTKPNSWRDFIACAEYLIARKFTSPAHLAAEGRSSGGALVGRVITERPDLFGAAILEAGDTDSLRTELMETGPANIPEFGTVKERDGFKALYDMSAYAHVIEGARYPAVMLLTGIKDHNVAPWQPAKMAARLQAATTGGRPVLLRVEYESGHGIASTRKQWQEQLADKLAFLFWQLDPTAPP
ncbi:MAG TPA: prolyl oligopeptidase family serine peptidase [Candidatus Polarisedimenticolia bacterium]|jgi:prolyl oligopeptidase|nr:prolyl oligopeptidase family serine peptidase [Candidatus Polarisedimenticolia bacterium]